MHRNIHWMLVWMFYARSVLYLNHYGTADLRYRESAYGPYESMRYGFSRWYANPFCFSNNNGVRCSTFSCDPWVIQGDRVKVTEPTYLPTYGTINDGIFVEKIVLSPKFNLGNDENIDQILIYVLIIQYSTWVINNPFNLNLVMTVENSILLVICMPQYRDIFHPDLIHVPCRDEVFFSIIPRTGLQQNHSYIGSTEQMAYAQQATIQSA